ncbi:hypothetical protein [Caudoviricetes sp.]|nr:hypothetical protein [Caudoviricetes sp.]
MDAIIDTAALLWFVLSFGALIMVLVTCGIYILVPSIREEIKKDLLG